MVPAAGRGRGHVPIALWHHGHHLADRQRLEELREAAGYDWRTVRSFRSKEEAGHEEPWFTFLAGDNPDYPEKILAATERHADIHGPWLTVNLPASTRIRLTLTLAPHVVVSGDRRA